MGWTGKKVLVTGAGGFIGSHLVERLVGMGADVRVFVRYNSRNDKGFLDELPADMRDSLDVFAGDIKDSEAVRRSVRDCEVVFHLAALIAIPFSYTNPLDFVQTNVLGAANVLNACLDCGVSRIVHTSTSEVYGTARYVPIDEDHPFQPQSPYSASKISADALFTSYFCSFGVPVSIIRPFNTYGPRQSMRAVIPTIIVQALKNKTIRLGSLSPTRDFNYIDDTIDGFISIAESERSLGQVINIGSGREISIGDLVSTIAKLLGKKVHVVTEDERLRPERSEVFRLCAQNRRAKELLNWSPKVSLEDGLKRTIEWLRKVDPGTRTDKYVL